MPSVEVTMEQYQALLAGLPKYWPSNQTFFLEGQQLTVPQVVSLINVILAAMAASTQARGAWTEALAQEKEAIARNGPLVRGVRAAIAEAFVNSPGTLVALDVQPRKAPRPLTAEARLVAKAKAKATREARGTTSKKQKAKITGNVTGVTVTPITTGATPTAAVAPTPASTGVTSPPATPTSSSSSAAPTVTVGAVGAVATNGSPHS